MFSTQRLFYSARFFSAHENKDYDNMDAKNNFVDR